MKTMNTKTEKPRNFKVLICKCCNDTTTVRQDLVDGYVCDNCNSDSMIIFPGDYTSTEGIQFVHNSEYSQN
jgi:Zn finger protein HypA/HybF involved in hydrogenase expression